MREPFCIHVQQFVFLAGQWMLLILSHRKTTKLGGWRLSHASDFNLKHTDENIVYD
jgi:hypothetical protein